MPYKVERKGDEFVVRSPKGVKGKHKSKKKARAQQRALYANTAESKTRNRYNWMDD